MRYTTTALLILALFAAAVVAAGCGTARQDKAEEGEKATSAVCPVMGTRIPDVTRAAGRSVHKGKTYYFCCAGCKPLFDKDPERYIKKK